MSDPSKCKFCGGEMEGVFGFQPVAAMNSSYQQCKKCGAIDYGTYRYLA